MCGEGLLLLLSGPSGVGKGTLRNRLLEVCKNLHYCVSVTTREPREGEEDGKDYHFVSRSEFERRIEQGCFVEHAEVYGNFYGTPREPMESLLAKGQDVIIEKDIQGALTLRDEYPDAVLCFVLPPSLAALEHRIKRRGTEEDQTRRRRLARAKKEIRHLSFYDYFVVNDEVAESVRCLKSIITAEKNKVERCSCHEFLSPGGVNNRFIECNDDKS